MNNRIQLSKVSALSVAAALTCISGLAIANSWTVTVLQTTTTDGFPTVNAVWENRQAGSIDPGLQQPTIWLGAPGTAFEAAIPQGNSSATIVAMTQSNLIGDAFVQDFGGFVVLVWNAQGTSFQVIQPPAPFTAAFARGAAANQQVGVVEDFNIGASAPALWTGTTESFVNLLPQGFDGGVANGTDGVQQVGGVFAAPDFWNTAALWSGTANSFVSLHPGGVWLDSSANDVDNGVQVGSVFNGDDSFAAFWTGTPQSMTLLHPTQVIGATDSEAKAIHNNVVCGSIDIEADGERFTWAALWTSPNSASFVNLHALLGPGFIRSEAVDVFVSDDGIIRVVGNVDFNGESAAVLWTYDPCGFALDIPASTASLAGDLDGDLVVDSCQPLAPEDDCNANGLRDSDETLAFTNETFENDAGLWSMNGSASITENYVQLTPPELGQGGSAVRGPLTDGPTQRVRAIFDFRSDSHLLIPADGFSFTLFDATTLGTNAIFGEDGIALPGAITVKFNTFENELGEGSNSMFVIYGGDVIAGNTNLPFSISDENWHRAVVDLTPDGQITVGLATVAGDIQTVFNNVQLPNYQPEQYNIGFGARTGAFASRHAIANVRLGVNGPNDLNGDGVPDECASSCSPCPADYDNNGGVDGGDLAAFFTDFEAGEACADVDLNGGVDGGDLATFFTLFELGGC